MAKTQKFKLKLIFGKKKTRHYLNKILRLLGKKNVLVLFRQLGSKTSGESEPGLIKIIYLNAKHDILPTAIHEALHILYPDVSHKKIYLMEFTIHHHMSEAQNIRLLNKLTEAINRSRQIGKEAAIND